MKPSQPFSLVFRNTSRRELMLVLGLWMVLCAVAAIALFLLNANALRIINHIEYVSAGRYIRMLALYEQAKKHADHLLEHAADANRQTPTKVLLSKDDAEYKAAVDLYKRAMVLDPRDPYQPTHSGYYQILMRLHEAVGAYGPMYSAQTLDALTRRDYKNAADYVTSYTVVAPREAAAWELAAEVPLRAGKYDEALSATEKLESLKIAPAWEPAALRGRVALARADWKTAARELSAAVQANSSGPENTDLRKKLASAYLQQKRPDEAIRVFEEGRKFGGDTDANYLHLYGETLLAQNKNREALEVLKIATRIEQHSDVLYWALARAYHRLGDKRRSDEALQHAFEANPALRGKVLEP